MAIIAAGLLNAGWAAAGTRPRVYVLESGTMERVLRKPAAIGLYVPGAGGTISRTSAIESLRRGEIESDLLGGTPDTKILVDLVPGIPAGPSPHVVVELPPPGRHANTRRYRVAVVAPGYNGILTSSATRIRGLVPIAEIAPTAVALQKGRPAPIRSVADDDPLDDLQDLDQRLARVHKDRGWTIAVVVLTVLALAAVVPAAGIAGGAAAVASALVLSWADATQLWVVLLAIALLTAALAFAAARFVLPAIALFLAVFLVVLAAVPETNSLAVLGPRPDGGGRFYGITNLVETLLLAPILAAASIAGLASLVPIGLLAIVMVAWSKAGADGGGILVYGVALVVLALRQRAVALTPRRLALVGATVAVLGLALVALDAALGGSSHVTHAVDTGPGSLLGDLGRRLHLSWASATVSWHRGLIFLGCVAGLVWLGTIRPRPPTVEAFLVAIVVSLVVNDTPVDVIGMGALGCAALVRWESVDSRRMRRGALFAASVVTLLTLAGCGSEGVVSPTANRVVGKVKQEAAGKKIFIAQGCGSCHTYAPAGPDATGNIGPDLGKLAEFAKAAKQPLPAFVHQSIVSPDAYIEKGFPKGVMPKSYKSLPEGDLNDLVEFLSKQPG